ncbi:MAG: hypothetical protein QXO76_06435, partial [Thermoproteota archaeon]
MKSSENSKEIKNFLATLDSLSGQVSESEIADLIRKFIKEKFGENPPEDLFAEQMAFDFLEEYPSNKTGFVFGVN